MANAKQMTLDGFDATSLSGSPIRVHHTDVADFVKVDLARMTVHVKKRPKKEGEAPVDSVTGASRFKLSRKQHMRFKGAKNTTTNEAPTLDDLANAAMARPPTKCQLIDTCSSGQSSMARFVAIFVPPDSVHDANSWICECTRNNTHASIVTDHRAGDDICSQCGTTRKSGPANGFQDNFYSGNYNNIRKPSVYRRINHFMEWVHHIQGQNSKVSRDIIEQVRTEIDKYRISKNDISVQFIRGILKKLKLNHYYEHMYYIYSQITGAELVRLSDDLVKKMTEMFHEVQDAFVKTRPQGRKNFLSYSYVIHKFCILLNRSELVVFFPLLKSREKLIEQDRIWKTICGELNWEFTASI